jgi:hypothetical protein
VDRKVINSAAFSGFVVKNDVVIKTTLLDVSYVERLSGISEIVICMVRHKKVLWSLFKSFHFLKVTEDLQENQQVL